METVRTRRWDFVLAVCVGLVALSVYLFTLAQGVFPGEFSAILSQGANLSPRLSPNRPLWCGLCWLLRHIPATDPAAAFNLSAAILGGFSVSMLCWVLTQLVLGLARVDEDNEPYVRAAARLAGLCGSLSMAFCVPFWIVSTRSHWASLDIFWFLLACIFFVRACLLASNRSAIVFALIYGIGVVEYPTFVLFGPLFIGAYAAALAHREELEFRRVAPPTIALVLGLGLYFLASWRFQSSPGYALRGYHGYFEVLWSMWRDQWYLIARSLPQQGWLLVVVVTILPAAAALLVSRRALNNEQDWTYYLLHVVFTGLAVAVLLNVSFSPWGILGFQRLLVMPYLLQAATFGYLVAYWFLLPTPWSSLKWRGPSRGLRLAMGTVMGVAALALVIGSSLLNFTQADGRRSALIRGAAGEIVRGLGGHRWLLTDGTLDDAILVEARRANVSVRLINMSFEQNKIYKQYVASMFNDLHLRNLMQLSLHTAVRYWIEHDPTTVDTVAVMNGGDYWIQAGLQAVPNGTVFFGAKHLDAPVVESCLRQNRESWQRLQIVPYFAYGSDAGPLDYYRQYMHRHLSLVANNLGILLEDAGRKQDAYEAYTQARKFDRANASALMNQYTLIQHGFQAPEAEAVRKDLADYGAAVKGKPPRIRELSHYYGDIRSPSAFAQLGWEWASSGKPELADSGLRRAMGLIAEKDRGRLKQALAGLYLMQRRPEESEGLYYELLVEDPEDQAALLGMARIELDRGNTDKARMYLERAAAAKVPANLMNLEWASFEIATHNFASAKERLRNVLKAEPELVRAWAMLTAINVQEDDPVALSDTVRHIGRLKSGNEFLLAVSSGYLAIMQDDWENAAMEFDRALVLHPDDVQILEWLVRLDALRGQSERLEQHVTDLLRLDPKNALGNFVLGSLQMKDRQFDLARDSLNASLATRRSPEALNDLAWLLQESGLYGEAETNARTAIKMKPELAQAWDTLAVILLKTDRLEEARQALEKARSIAEDDVPITLHLIELDLKQGRRESASKRAEGLEARRSDMSTDDRKILDDLRRQL